VPEIPLLRDWQQDGLGRLLRAPGDFLLVATPGAGKTRFALTAAMRLKERGDIRQVVVAVPTAHLRKQWAEAAAVVGLKLDNEITNRATGIAPGTDGAVVTFSMAASAPLAWRHIAEQAPTLVILDEVHHCGDKRAWGPAINEAFKAGVRRLLLSGTPFRSDGTPIPFVKYGSDGRCAPDYEYGYGPALAGGVVRPVQFQALDGDMTYRKADRLMWGALSGVPDKKAVSATLAAAYDPDGLWIKSVLAEADRELTRHRESVPDAAGLVLAPDQDLAESYADILRLIAGERPALVISNDRGASEHITEFAGSSARWIVAVQMVSEGVDIPRLEVGVYASRVKTEMFFRQVVGRFVRMRGAQDRACATLFIPSVPVLLRHAASIERTADSVLREAFDGEREPAEAPSRRLSIVEAVESSEARPYATVNGGESFTDEELRRAELLAQEAGLPGNVTAVQLARALRLAGEERAEDPILKRWRWARMILEDQALTTPNGRLRHGALDRLVENADHKRSRRDIQLSVQLGNAYPTMAHVRRAIAEFGGWKAIVESGFPPITMEAAV
jgi:superfamily II DNA or RNA helicase